MDCPTCQSPMTQGEISLEVTWADLVMGSGGASVLRFHEPHKEPFTIMRESESLPGLNCQTCGLLWSQQISRLPKPNVLYVTPKCGPY